LQFYTSLTIDRRHYALPCDGNVNDIISFRTIPFELVKMVFFAAAYTDGWNIECGNYL
jgi:hypothetical protein